jgi:hypothetical protein
MQNTGNWLRNVRYAQIKAGLFLGSVAMLALALGAGSRW